MFYDSDVDGMSSGTIMRKYLLNFTDKVECIFTIGKKHGLEHIDLNSVIDKTDILIIVDSSTANHKEQDFLKEHGIEVIIADHHDEPDNPNVCIVNSQFNNYPNPQLSGSGVTWKLCLAIDESMNTKYAFNYVDLAATGIIGDQMNVGEQFMENRFIAFMGFHNLQNMAIKTIIDKYEFNATSVLFSIAPLINSSARMKMNQLAVDFLMCDSKKECKERLKELKELKEKQKEIVAMATSNLEFQIRSQDYENNKIVYGFVDNSEIAGLIASKMCEKYGKPAIVLHYPEDGDTQYMGSIRGIGINNFKTIINDTGLAKAQGHPSAAGIFIPIDNFEFLIKKLNEVLKNVEFKDEKDIDVVLSPEQISFTLIEELEKVNIITGKGFEQIKVAIKNVEPRHLMNMQKKHIKFDDGYIQYIKWNSFDEYDKFWSSEIGIYVTCDLMGTLSISHFRGRRTGQMIINDACNFKDNLEFMRSNK